LSGSTFTISFDRAGFVVTVARAVGFPAGDRDHLGALGIRCDDAHEQHPTVTGDDRPALVRGAVAAFSEDRADVGLRPRAAVDHPDAHIEQLA
jgi:hypothetical protein